MTRKWYAGKIKQAKTCALLLLAAVLCLSGCGGRSAAGNTQNTDILDITGGDWEDKAEKSDGIVTKDAADADKNADNSAASQELQQIEENQVDEDNVRVSKEELEAKREAAGLAESDISGLKLEQSGNYYYGQCSDEEKTLYVELYQILCVQEEEILLSTTDAGLLSRVYQCVINDHPELFYLNGYTYTQYTRKGEIQYLTFSGRYLYEPGEVQERRQKIDAAVNEVLGQIIGYDDYGKVKAVYEYLIFNTDYSTLSPDNQNICSVFLDHSSVCNGYAKAAQYLLNNAGVPCIIVNGNAGGAHAWNIVEIDGAYYHMDATWGDPSYYTEEAGGTVTPDIDYSYLCVTTAEIIKNHSIDETFPLPECTSRTDNYFVREGLYLSGFEEEKLQEIFRRAQESGQRSVAIKASDGEAYQELYDNLITGQKIFDYFGSYNGNGEYSIAYSGNDELYTISFWM